MSNDHFRKLRQLLMEKLDLARELSDQEILEQIDDLILNGMRESALSLKEKVQLRQELFYSVRKLDVLQELIEDDSVTEIMVNGPESIFVERAGKLKKWEKGFTSREKLEDVKCGDPPGCLKRSDPYDPKVPGHTDHNGETDRPWKSSAGMCRVSGDSCKSEIFHGDRRWNRQREDDISGGII